MRKKMFFLGFLVVLVCSLIQIQPSSSQESITITDLGPPDSPESEARDINDLGQICGTAWTEATGNKPYLWTSDGGMVNIYDSGWPYFEVNALAINNLGQVAGNPPFVWSAEDGVTDITNLVGGATSVFAVNDLGQVAGTRWNPTPSPSGAYSYHAFLWSPEGGQVDLYSDFFSIAFDINNLGQVVGGAAIWDVNNFHAFLWSAEGGMIDLGTLGGDASEAMAINDFGWVVGRSATTLGETHAFLWTPESGMLDLGTLGGTYSSANDINDFGQIAGNSLTASWYSHAFLWTAEDSLVDLGTLGGDKSTAYGINNMGQVVGNSETADGVRHATLWTLQITPPTAYEQIEAIIEEVIRLVDDGVLNQGQGKSLTVKLENAERMLDKGNTEAVGNMLGAFTNQIEAFLQADILPGEEGQAWVDAANQVIDTIE